MYLGFDTMCPVLRYTHACAFLFTQYWREYIKRFGFVVYHPTGTCKMGRGGPGAAAEGTVVDSSLKVLGVTGLRVADASIMPDIVSGNTQVRHSSIRSPYGCSE